MRAAAIAGVCAAAVLGSTPSPASAEVKDHQAYTSHGFKFDNTDLGSTDAYLNVDYTGHVIRPYAEAGLSPYAAENCNPDPAARNCSAYSRVYLTREGYRVTSGDNQRYLTSGYNNLVVASTSTYHCDGSGYRSFEDPYQVVNRAGQLYVEGNNIWVSDLIRSYC